MKSAIILSGQLRNFTECFPSFREFVLENNDHHIYMHTYGDSDPAQLQEAISLYKPRRLLLEWPEKDFDICETCGPQREPFFWQWRHIKLTFRLIPPNTYPCVVKARYDLVYTQPIKFEEHDLNAINIPHGGNFLGGTNDLFAFSTSANMEYYCSMIDHINRYVTIDGIACHPETLLKHHLRDKLVHRPIFPLILRGNVMTDWL